MSAKETEVLIIGAGPAGASLALALAKAGFETLVVDARDPKGKRPADTRNYAVVTGSWRLLKRIGIAPVLEGQTQPLHGLEATDGGTHWFGQPHVLFDDEDLPDREDGETLGHMVEAPVLQAALDAAMAEQEGLTLLAPARFVGYEAGPGGVTVTLDSGETIHARLLIGADGVNSPVREAAGIQTEGRDYQKSVFAANVTLSRPHDGIARQLFTPEGPFATLPLRGDRANLAWYMKRGAAEALAKMTPEAVEAELNHRFADFAGEMKIYGPMGSYPLILKIAEHMVDTRVALVGDAVRRINPLAGQGLNQGFRDIAALYDAIMDADRAGLDIGSEQTLSAYQASRRFGANTAALGMDVIDRLFSNDSMLTKPVRSLGMLAAERIAPVRKRLAGIASASFEGLPSLMQPLDAA
ncbi:FAD-dependent oxidoreductase [Henriciella mobilis]|uniref:FAD-dependent oxidoreductase n=1 Tax=Henriciella mobilis TaxID=2305467 RepID=UPI000E66AD67|nr:FAD-dependent oxidoreductase [Henriciella mobilis]RIJ17829.1 FAD-dependent oxidoreductase [Henriciella mobilis]RIJ25358.1 FAD-dependent oxidoreductase [Henriciella mobilis]